MMKFLHTMLRVNNLEESIKFYQEILFNIANSNYYNEEEIIYLKFNSNDLNIKNAMKNSKVVGADINELSPIKGFDSYNFLTAKLAYKIISYSFKFKKNLYR